MSPPRWVDHGADAPLRAVSVRPSVLRSALAARSVMRMLGTTSTR